MRPILVKLHRWAGLTTAVFLFITGLTGAVISWDHELDDLLNSHLTEAHTPGQPQPVMDLVQKVETTFPTIEVLYFPTHAEAGHALEFYVQPRLNPETGKAYAEEFNQVFIDPVSGEILGKRKWGAVWPITRENFVSFLYKLHYSLHLPEMFGIDQWGVWLLGIIALIWTLDCFGGLLLTVPKKIQSNAKAGSSRFGRWLANFKIRWNKGSYKLNFDLHQAFSLWTWGLLLVVAFTAFSLNLYREVFFPAMSLVSDVTPTPYDERPFTALSDVNQQPLGFSRVMQLAQTEAQEKGWSEPLGAVFYARNFGLYDVKFFNPEDDHGTGGGGHKTLYFDAHSGKPLGQRIPWTGTAADLFVQAQFPLHSGRILGLPGRILISLMGIVVALLSVTGVIIWWRKHSARRRTRARRIENGDGPAVQS
ncbi:MAG: peptidase [Oceanospirillaceae bacterium]|nr:peptidase [Oceanospirillaceae bacterium]MBT13116.1 peptidase [Oceanospirillaceae bacterium]|tara:strand:- start:28260 stop:29522 length:1263 start_codon:yes stop_codon:yes gene_type:complete